MAINLDDRYPGRANPKSLSYPQGSFKNRTSPSSKDGTYLEQDWANDLLAFFQSMLKEAGITANGLVDTAQASQYYDALIKTISDKSIPGAIFAEINALTGDEGPIICIDQGGAVYVWGGSGYVPLLASELRAGAVRFATTAEAQALVNDTNAITPQRLGDAMNAHVLGMGQTWQNVTSSRSIGTIYTNTTGRAIVVSVTAVSGGGWSRVGLTISGVNHTSSSGSPYVVDSNEYSSASGVVPPGSQYSVVNMVGNIHTWAELR